MLFGFAIQGWMVAAGGLTLLATLAFQVLLGLRKITFKGPLHMKVHKAVAYVLLGLAALHGLAGLAFVGIV